METRREDIPFSATDRTPGRRGLNIRGLIQVLVGIGALALLIYKADARGLWKAINDTKLAYLPLAVLATVTVNNLGCSVTNFPTRPSPVRVSSTRVGVTATNSEGGVAA